MGSRYLVTGTQLGMIKGLVSAKVGKSIDVKQTGKIYEDITKLVDQIVKDQYVCNSRESIDTDIKTIKGMALFTFGTSIREED